MGRWSASELYRLYLWCMPLRVAWCHFILSAPTHHSAHVSWRVTWKWSAGNMACSHDKPSWGRTRFRVKKTVEICWDTKLRQETSVLLVEIMIITCTLNVEELVSSCFVMFHPICDGIKQPTSPWQVRGPPLESSIPAMHRPKTPQWWSK